jgi:hypothetical protein
MDADQMRRWMTQMREDAAQHGQGPDSSGKQGIPSTAPESSGPEQSRIRRFEAVHCSFIIHCEHKNKRQEGTYDIVQTAKRTARKF